MHAKQHPIIKRLCFSLPKSAATFSLYCRWATTLWSGEWGAVEQTSDAWSRLLPAQTEQTSTRTGLLQQPWNTHTAPLLLHSMR
jgi:hypothetical protein